MLIKTANHKRFEPTQSYKYIFINVEKNRQSESEVKLVKISEKYLDPVKIL